MMWIFIEDFGSCSGFSKHQRIGQDQHKKHFLGLSDNVTCFTEQLKTTDVSVYYRSVSGWIKKLTWRTLIRTLYEEVTSNDHFKCNRSEIEAIHSYR